MLKLERREPLPQRTRGHWKTLGGRFEFLQTPRSGRWWIVTAREYDWLRANGLTAGFPRLRDAAEALELALVACPPDTEQC